MAHKSWVFVVFLFFSCEKGLPNTEAGLRTMAEQIASDREEFDQSKYTWSSGDVSSDFTAFLRGAEIFLIEEKMTRGDSGVSENQFYFFANTLFFYREKRTNSDGSVLEIEVLFNREGEVVAQKQLNDGKVESLASYVVPLAKKHANTLRDVVNEGGAGR